mmetsp:Transcript_1454/g.1951  ORF Transcript_1454/g.1951 Transcript_1454/m.1951 type:complete len:565 (-) Transcript_1454:54-1748(-)
MERALSAAKSAINPLAVCNTVSSVWCQKVFSHFTMADKSEANASQEEIIQAYEDALDDVHTRFILNLPPEELATSDRIFFQLEQAYWFYDDFICDNSKLKLPRFNSLKPFAQKMFEMSPMLNLKHFDKMWEEFSAYRRKISNYGTILLNNSCTKMVLCQAWNSNAWTFPAGKVNQNEAGTDAGSRETYEETGFDPNCDFGLTKKMLKSGTEMTWKALREEDALVVTESGKRRTMYVCRGVPEDFPFAPVARKEVSAVQWHEIDNIPKKSFAVQPFMKQLRRWIKKKGRTGKRKDQSRQRAGSTNKSRSRNSSRGRVSDDDPLTETGLANPGDTSGWSEQDMFNANEKILGRKVTYDGNPHHFAEKGFDGKDPHAFKVIGGSFMNSGGTNSLEPPPDKSILQPLFRKESINDEGELLPFFSETGETPWGEIIESAGGAPPCIPSREKGANERTREEQKEDQPTKKCKDKAIMLTSDSLETAFLTDAAITAKSQNEKTSHQSRVDSIRQTRARDEHRQAQQQQYKKNLEYIQQWLANLSDKQTRNQENFRFNVDKIFEAMAPHLEK